MDIIAVKAHNGSCKKTDQRPEQSVAEETAELPLSATFLLLLSLVPLGAGLPVVIDFLPEEHCSCSFPFFHGLGKKPVTLILLSGGKRHLSSRFFSRTPVISGLP